MVSIVIGREQRIIKIAAILFAGLLLLCGTLNAANLPKHPLLEQAKSECSERLKYALKNNARVELTADGKSFYVLWYPEGRPAGGQIPVIVTMHGHGSWAFDEFYLWHKVAGDRGYGILAIQWWLGHGERFQDYLDPKEIYIIIDDVLSREGAGSGTVLFHGFSRGSANSYAVAAIDCQRGKDYFALIVANSGKSELDFPPNQDIEKGLYGPKPFQGTHWVTFAGGRDPYPEKTGIPGMREAAGWIRKHGGTVDLAIEDENAGHGGFHRDPGNMRSALDLFDGLRRSG